MKVPFNQPYVPKTYIVDGNSLRGLGKYYNSCRRFIEKELGFKRVLLTGSCTAALEVVALALNIQPGDEVIVPSYTYVSTANAFALRGARLKFVDCRPDHPSMDLDLLEKSITSKTKAIVIVHYGGVALDYDRLKQIRKRYNIPLIEDAAHCFGSYSGKKVVGSLGDFSTFSFHETKNITCGQGGALIVNNPSYWKTANMVVQCGTDKQDFIDKRVSYYSWKMKGSNYLLAEALCAILLVNLKHLKSINSCRATLFEEYYSALSSIDKTKLRFLSPFQKGGNGHIFYLATSNKKTRDGLIEFLKIHQIEATFHYSPLHLSEYYKKSGGKQVKLKNAEFFGETLVRLPMFYELSPAQQKHVIKKVKEFFS